MPYRMKVDGMEELSETLGKMGEMAASAASQGLYEGAGVMAKALNNAAGAIKTEPFHYVRNGTRLPSPEEKAIVTEAAAGIAKFDKNGSDVNTSVGFRNSGYAQLNGRTKPIPLIVNSINSGTSFMRKQPFVRQAAKEASAPAMEAIKKKIEEVFESTTK